MEHMTHEGGVVIYNPTAGRGRAGLLIKQATALLGPGFEWIPSQKAGHAVELAREAAKTHQVVVAFGGDGTAGDVVKGIAGSEATLGIIPVGTGNDLARNLGLKLDLGESVATILGGMVRRIDIGTVNGIPFVNNCGTGFDSHVMKTMNSSIRFVKGQPAFLLAMIKNFPTYPPFTLTVEYEGNTGSETFTEKAMSVSVLNGKMYGGGMIAAPHADMDDGNLDVMIIKSASKMQLLPLLNSVRSGGHISHPAVRMLQVRKIKLQTIPPQPINIDGDVSGLTPAVIEVKPNSLKVMVR